MNIKNKNLALSLATASGLLVISACGGGGGGGSSNTAPTAIAISANSVAENAAGAVVGTLSATDADSGDTATFTTSNADFEISGTSLKLKDEVSLNFEKTPTVSVSVTVTDSGNLSFTQALTINVTDVLDTYKFENADGNSTVSYSGQVTRMALISELNQYISSELQADLNSGELTSRQAVIDKLNSFYEISEQDYDLRADTFVIDFIDTLEQTTLRQLSSSQKDLIGKIAGNDAVGQHKDWNNGAFEGWGAAGSTTPHGLVQIYFGMLGDNAQAFIDGNIRQDFNGNEINTIYLTTDGRDLKQLIQKFLLGAVAFSQGADDYFDNDTAGKGLMVSNIATDSDYTSLEHQWDEGYGYFGAARDYLEYTDDEIAGKGGREEYSSGRHDSNGDSVFDLKSEVNLGNSTNAAKRDRGTAALTNPTDYTSAAFNALLSGRKIINDNIGSELTTEQMAALVEQRNIVVDHWEKSISATVVHYINDTIADLDKLGTAEFNYADLAKHWSEMKGFALNLQFSRFSPLSDANYTELHNLLKDAPVVAPEADLTQYKADLLAARAILQTAYSFEQEHVENW
ncbi:DUF4856 domain-containing protein [Aliikangiella coralliicola]|uniref:DUF4856 domain-containing protein n=1 Tax=Aliikangiella coralliicola TaxID=2592383 RepID=A0A545UCE1_9GAMM|nr:DUF4856 domain-containing protein [Aliikangiella coralliicola]TQV87093.1 DUF4856 domain-containing protein [Aliikangiella coralliicola]